MACHFCKISSVFHLRRHINLRVGGRLSKTPEKEVAVYTEDRGQGNTNKFIKSEFIIILGKLSLSVEIQIRFWSDCLIETR